MIEKAIYNILRTDADLTALAPHIYFGVEPGKDAAGGTAITKDYIVFYRNSTEPNDTKTGRSTLDEAQVHVNCFSESADRSATLAETVRGVLDRYSGTSGGVKVQSIQYTNQINLFEFNETYNTRGLFQITQFYHCRFEPQYL